MDIVVGLLMIGLGLVLAFSGLRVFTLLLPMLGFLAGVSLGVSMFHHFFDEGFLSTAGGLVIGVIIGIVFAVLSYLFWYVAVVLGGAFIGASMGVGFMQIFDVNTTWLLWLAAIAGGIVIAALTILLDLPLYWVVIITAFAGATWALGGGMLILDEIDRSDLERGTIWAAIEESWWWILAWVIVAALGMGAQLTLLADALTPPENKWEKMPATV